MSEPFVGPNGYIWVQILVPRVRVLKVVKNDVILVDKLDKGDGHGHVLDYGTVYRAIFTPCQAIHVRHCSSMVTRLGSKRGHCMIVGLTDVKLVTWSSTDGDRGLIATVARTSLG